MDKRSQLPVKRWICMDPHYRSATAVTCVPLSAVRCVIFTVDPTEARRTGAGVTVDTVCAVGVVLAWVALALVDVFFTLGAPEARQAGAQEAVHLVRAEASVAAGVCRRTEEQLI